MTCRSTPTLSLFMSDLLVLTSPVVLSIPSALLFQVPGSQGNMPMSYNLCTPENIPFSRVQFLGYQPTFYFTVHSCKFLHFQGNQITFQLALLVTKPYNDSGFKNKVWWYAGICLPFNTAGDNSPQSLISRTLPPKIQCESKLPLLQLNHTRHGRNQTTSEI